MNNYDEIERKIFLIKNYLEDNLSVAEEEELRYGWMNRRNIGKLFSESGIKKYCLQSWNIGNGKKRKPIGK